MQGQCGKSRGSYSDRGAGLNVKYSMGNGNLYPRSSIWVHESKMTKKKH